MIKGVRFFELDPDIKICICKKCGVVFEDKTFSKEFYDEFYRRFYHNLYKGFQKNEFEWEKEVTLKNYERLRLLRKILSKKKKLKILEVGCWDGTFLKEFFREYPNSEIVGIESSEDYYNMAKKLNPKLSVCNKTFEDFETRESFDIIVLGMVIRHFFNPIKSFKKIRNLLKDDGFFYFDYGEDLFELHLRNPKDNPYNWFSHQKRFYYSKKTLQYLLDITGFEIIKESKGFIGCPLKSPLFVCKKKKPTKPKFDKEHFREVLKYFNEEMPKITKTKNFIENLKNRLKRLLIKNDKIFQFVRKLK